MTRDAVDALGGMPAVVNKGETVFIKPNFVSIPWAQHNKCFHIGDCTKPEIIIAVADECLKAGAAEVVIGEGSQMPKFEWQYAITLDGNTNLVKEAARLSSKYDGKVTLACLEKDSPGWIDVPSKTPLGKIAVSSLVAKADKVISLPGSKNALLGAAYPGLEELHRRHAAVALCAVSRQYLLESRYLRPQ